MATDFGFLPVTSGKHYFISYNTEDTDRVRPVAQALYRAGVPLWYDYGLEYGKEWERQIAHSIHSAKAVIMFVTNNVFKKERSYARKEYDIAEAYQVPVIPVVLENVDGSGLPEHSIGWWMDIRALHSVRCVSGESAEALCVRIRYALGLSKDNPAASSAPVAAGEMSPEEMNRLGGDYYLGKNGKPQDYRQAVSWYRKAAAQNNADAQNNLGYCFQWGHGEQQDHAEAVRWYRRAAERGHAGAQNNLGYCCQWGLGTPQNSEEAAEWYRKAAEQGHPDAQTNLGYCYRHGYGVPQSSEETVRWYRKAAEQGNASAQNNLGLCYDNGYGVSQDYTEAVKWYRKAVEQGNASAKYNLGVCCQNGHGLRQDYAEAIRLYREAAEQGHSDAQNRMGICCENGRVLRRTMPRLSECSGWLPGREICPR